MIELAITLGIIISLLFIESFGLAAGGLVVPGYIALQLDSIDKILGTILVSVLTYGIIYSLSKVMFLFGRRQMVVSLLIGTILSIISHNYLFANVGDSTFELNAVGWVIPGLIAHWSLKQGVVKTFSILTITSILVRLIVIIAYQGALFPYSL